ncbi:MAG: hypothetical protein RBR59_02400 [Sulfurimonadaceae bacterium]|jgi:predicted RNase H-like nuclease (RuvC/YqgF family)|nr:hypothetical protein [Sulfurimonadaceae bacterium]
MRLTIDEYSKYFKMSKEMVQSKLKAKKINYIIENGMTYIIVTKKSVDSQKHQEIQESIAVQPPMLKLKPTVATVLGLYQRENKQLKAKIIELEAKIDKLIGDKEQMLRDERDKIEKLYTLKDTQLKEILELVNKKITLESQKNNIHTLEHQFDETFEDINIEQAEEIENKNLKLVELSPYLKSLDLKSYQRKIIKKRFLHACNNDVRIIQQNGRIYLDFSRYDYSDLLTH